MKHSRSTLMRKSENPLIWRKWRESHIYNALTVVLLQEVVVHLGIKNQLKTCVIDKSFNFCPPNETSIGWTVLLMSMFGRYCNFTMNTLYTISVSRTTTIYLKALRKLTLSSNQSLCLIPWYNWNTDRLELITNNQSMCLIPWYSWNTDKIGVDHQ